MFRKVALFVVLAVVIVGCSQGESSMQASATGGDAPREKVGGQRDASAFVSAGGAADGGGSGFLVSQNSQRAEIRSATLQMRVEKLDDAENKVESAVKSSGGYELTVSSSDLASENANLSIVAKVPVGKLDDVISKIEGLGTRLAKTVSMQDVNDELVGTDAQIKVLQQERDHFKDKTTDPYGDRDSRVASLQEQLRQLQTQRDALAKRAAMATLNLSLRQGAVPGVGHDPNWLAQAYGQSSSSSLGALRVVATGAMYILFMSPFWLPFAIVGWFVYRSYRRKAPGMVTAPPTM